MHCRIRRSTSFALALIVAAALRTGIHGGPTVSADGYGFDWDDVEPTLCDPVGDGEPGFFDLTDVYTHADQRGLYFLAQVVDPSQPLA